MAFKMQVASNTPLIGEEDPDTVLRISAYYNLTLYPDSNLTKKFVTPLLGKAPDVKDFEDNSLDLEQFLGKDCRIDVRHVIRKSDKERVAIVERVLMSKDKA